MLETMFYIPENPEYTIFDSARDSVRFAVTRCLAPSKSGFLSATSSFVDLEGKPMLWHDFGPLEGPGWAANAVGGAYEIYTFGSFLGDRSLKLTALSLLDHVLEDGFVDPNTGFIWPYRNVEEGRFCSNFKGNDEWLCPGSLARVGFQLLIISDVIPAPRAQKAIKASLSLGRWLLSSVRPLDNGWIPRRITPYGDPFPFSAEGGGEDPIFTSSGDGLFLILFFSELYKRGFGGEFLEYAIERAMAFANLGGIYGSINHDTYDLHENVSYAVAFRTMIRLSKIPGCEWARDLAYQSLKGLDRFKMEEDRNGVQTKGLLYMEESWDTAYLWENAEAALAYLEAYEDSGERSYLMDGLTILRAISKHHHGPYGFLTEGVDWNNHVGARHHINGREFGDIAYTEPLLNNLHIVEPTLFYVERIARKEKTPQGYAYIDEEGNILVEIKPCGLC
jgi:hypothetical protein